MNKIVFFGSGPVAAKSLELLSKHQTIEAVITKPRPLGHKHPFPVIELAKQFNLNIYTPSNKQELSKLFGSQSFESELGVVIDYGIIIPKEVIDSFKLGIVNSHFSLLPRWRGADPITFAILEGDSKSGVSLMLIDEGMDTGQLLAQKTLYLTPDETTPTLTDKLITLSDELLKVQLPRYIQGEIKPRKQPHPDRATYSRKLKKEDGQLDWTKPATELERQIRAFAGWPKSHTTLAGKDVSITKARVVDASGKLGDVNVNKNSLVITTSSYGLEIVRLQPAGKKEMTAQAFLAGHRHLL